MDKMAKATELGRIAPPLGQFVPLAGMIHLKAVRACGLGHEQCYVPKKIVKCRMCMATIHMLFQVRT